MTDVERAQLIDFINRMLKRLPDNHLSYVYYFILGLTDNCTAGKEAGECSGSR